MEAEKSLSAKERMQKAYFDLLETVHYTKINVTDVIKKAGVSRTTFYRNYVDIFDMHEKISVELGTALIEKCLDIILSSETTEFDLDVIVSIFNSQEKYIKLLAGKNGSRFLFESLLTNVSLEQLTKLLKLNDEQIFRLRFITMACVGVYVRDILDNREHNTEFVEVCKKVLKFDSVYGGSL